MRHELWEPPIGPSLCTQHINDALRIPPFAQELGAARGMKVPFFVNTDNQKPRCVFGIIRHADYAVKQVYLVSMPLTLEISVGPFTLEVGKICY